MSLRQGLSHPGDHLVPRLTGDLRNQRRWGEVTHAWPNMTF